MTAPKRIQRQRTKGWKMPDGAVYVGRPTKWGNPFKIGGPSGLARVPAVRYPDKDWEYEGRRTAAGAYHPYVSDEVIGHPKAIATPELSIKAYVPRHQQSRSSAIAPMSVAEGGRSTGDRGLTSPSPRFVPNSPGGISHAGAHSISRATQTSYSKSQTHEGVGFPPVIGTQPQEKHGRSIR